MPSRFFVVLTLLVGLSCRSEAPSPAPAPKPSEAPAPPLAQPASLATLAAFDDDTRRRAALNLKGQTPQAWLRGIVADAARSAPERRQAAFALAQFWSPGPGERATLEQALADPDPAVAVYAALATIRSGPAALPKALELFARVLEQPPTQAGESRDPQVVAAVFLARFAADHLVAQKAINAAATHANPGVQIVARGRLNAAGQPDPTLEDELARLVSDDRPGLRQAAAFAMAMRGPKHCTHGVAQFERLLKDSDPEVRSVAAGRLYFLGSCAIEAVQAAVQHQDGQVAFASVRTLITRKKRSPGLKLEQRLVELALAQGSGVRCQSLELLRGYAKLTPELRQSLTPLGSDATLPCPEALP